MGTPSYPAHLTVLNRRSFLRASGLGLLMAASPVAVRADDTATADSDQLFRDRHFREGFNLSNVTPSEGVTDVLGFGVRDTTPQWRLAQWGTRHSLAGARPHRLRPGTIPSLPGRSTEYANAGKRIVRAPNGGLWLEVAAENEYEHPRREGEAWPHLLIEQGWGAQEHHLAELRKLTFTLDVRIDRMINHMSPDDYDPEKLHAAQVTAYFTLVNTVEDSTGFGEMVWFGVPIVDNRHEIPPGWQAEDVGQPSASHQFINTVAGTEFWSASIKDGAWHSLRADLIPYMSDAYQTARDRGYLTETDYDDLHITSFNLGWEVPGTFNAAFQFKHLGARVHRH